VQVTPGGIRVCGRALLTAAELSALDELADAVRADEDRRYASLSPAERAAEDGRQEEAERRRRAISARLRGLCAARCPHSTADRWDRCQLPDGHPGSHVAPEADGSPRYTWQDET
jgi:hypothetical protein